MVGLDINMTNQITQACILNGKNMTALKISKKI